MSDRVAQLRGALDAAISHQPVILNRDLDIIVLSYCAIIAYVGGAHRTLCHEAAGPIWQSGSTIVWQRRGNWRQRLEISTADNARTAREDTTKERRVRSEVLLPRTRAPQTASYTYGEQRGTAADDGDDDDCDGGYYYYYYYYYYHYYCCCYYCYYCRYHCYCYGDNSDDNDHLLPALLATRWNLAAPSTKHQATSSRQAAVAKLGWPSLLVLTSKSLPTPHVPSQQAFPGISASQSRRGKVPSRKLPTLFPSSPPTLALTRRSPSLGTSALLV
ncbi:hypothetical protein AOQ84DRAFT_225382 [Glonium stellatum]|uniref:Uncharacterized protein n=1 Tax=Glonium stellatum TaxID=574774 RepID=A0A8E2JQ33_9PEZI|nr:hypothetical protein AOQ84DRAFT_225382 [Glonium stellatum]